MSAEHSPPELLPYLLRCIRELGEGAGPCLSQDYPRYRHSYGIWHQQLELCLRDLRTEGHNFTGTPSVRRALRDLQSCYDYWDLRAESAPDTETFASTDA